MNINKSLQKILIVLLIIVSSNLVFAKIWRIDQNPLTKPDFSRPQDAINDSRVLPGDTLYITPSQNWYNGIGLNKRLIIIGNGYFLNDNSNTQANKYSTLVGNISITKGAESSEIVGLVTGNIIVGCDSIKIIRNMMGTANFLLKILKDVNHILIKQNYFHAEEHTSGLGCIIEDNCTDIQFFNNFIKHPSLGIQVPINSSVWFENNTLQCAAFNIGNSVFYNNFYWGTLYQQNAIIQGNYSLGVPIENVIVNTGSLDAKWILKEGSPAKSGGINGAECGMFGGQEPYVLSGIPAIPSIYEAIVPDKVKNGENLNVKIKVKANN